VKIPRSTFEEIDSESTLHLILKSAVQALGGSSGVVAVWSEAEHCFILGASYGLPESAVSKLQPLLKEAAPDLATSSESYNFLSELQPERELPAIYNGTKLDPIIALPLKIMGRSIGLIFILRPVSAGAFTQMDKPVLAAFAEQAAIALHNARLAAVLDQEKHRVESVLENSADGIMSIDSRCRILGFNAAMERITGYSREEAVGQECARFFCFTDAEKKNVCNVKCPMSGALNADAATFTQTGTIRDRQGHPVEVSFTYSIVRSPEGQPVNAVVNVHDISKLREMENFRDTILSMLGHELQTPLAIIQGYTDILARQEEQSDQTGIQQGLQAIGEESRRLSQVVNKLLLASRLTGTEIKLEKEPVNLAVLAGKIVRRLSDLTSVHNFILEFPDDLPSVMAEPQLLEQVMTNLVENAVKYSPQGGKVIISGAKTGGQVKVTVADEGVGISMEDMLHLFERFYRGEKGQSHIKGTGLGLYISKTIIEAHGGHMEAASQPGRGSQFSFVLPAEKSS
jgi:PAS domain S-box-containing protein